MSRWVELPCENQVKPLERATAPAAPNARDRTRNFTLRAVSRSIRRLNGTPAQLPLRANQMPFLPSRGTTRGATNAYRPQTCRAIQSCGRLGVRRAGASTDQRTVASAAAASGCPSTRADTLFRHGSTLLVDGRTRMSGAPVSAAPHSAAATPSRSSCTARPALLDVCPPVLRRRSTCSVAIYICPAPAAETAMPEASPLQCTSPDHFFDRGVWCLASACAYICVRIACCAKRATSSRPVALNFEAKEAPWHPKLSWRGKAALSHRRGQYNSAACHARDSRRDWRPDQRPSARSHRARKRRRRHRRGSLPLRPARRSQLPRRHPARWGLWRPRALSAWAWRLSPSPGEPFSAFLHGGMCSTPGPELCRNPLQALDWHRQPEHAGAGVAAAGHGAAEPAANTS